MPSPPQRVVLLVDDVEQMTAIAAEYLSRHLEGTQVVATTRPQEALEWLRSAPRVDLVLSDNHMAEMDGLTLLREAKALRPECARALMTAYLDIAVSPQELGEMGVHALIRKPWEWPEFARFVRELLGLPAQERERREREGPIPFPEGAFAEFAARHARPPAPPAEQTTQVSASLQEEAPAPAAPAARVRRDAHGHAHVACPRCRTEFEIETTPAPAASAPAAPPQTPLLTTEDEEARRLLAYLRTRPGVERRMRAIEGAARGPQEQKAPERRLKG